MEDSTGDVSFANEVAKTLKSGDGQLNNINTTQDDNDMAPGATAPLFNRSIKQFARLDSNILKAASLDVETSDTVDQILAENDYVSLDEVIKDQLVSKRKGKETIHLYKVLSD